jgi:hypothetical protein
VNIFYIDVSPTQCAQWMVDKHVVKMILETCQLLSTAHRIIDGTPTQGKSKTGRNVTRYVLSDYREDILYQATHINHPSSVWCRESVFNYSWLYRHLLALNDEYEYRYSKTHKCSSLYEALKLPPLNIPTGMFSQPTPAMDKSFIISNDSVENYRNYYKQGKVHLHSWTKREKPVWL